MEQAVAQRYRGSWRVRWSSSPVVVLLGWALFTAPWDQALAGQLPPEIQVDRYILQAERAIQEQDYLGAKTAMDKILELQEQHDWELEEKFFFRYADVAERLGFHETAVKFLMQYLTAAGQDGEFYREALELLSTAEAAAAVIAGMEFVRVPAGEFLMSSTSEADDNEQPVSRGFDLGKYEVTQVEWEAVMGSNPSNFDECGPSCPVEMVSWDDVQEFIGRLNARAGGVRYRLPTEAEWEYAARAGTTTTYSWGNAIGNNRANCKGCGSQWDDRVTAPVGSFTANAWGLHDMHGNVWEWVEDCWHDSYVGVPADGSAWNVRGDCGRRVLRGGAWKSSPGDLRAAYRHRDDAGKRFLNVGFRVARTLAP